MRKAKQVHNYRIDRTLEMTSDASTNAGKNVRSNDASERCKRYTFYFDNVTMTFCVMTLRNPPSYVTTKRNFRWSDKKERLSICN